MTENIRFYKKTSDEIVSKGPHADYKKCLKFAEDFIQNCTGKLPAGMKVYISDSQSMPKSLVMTCFLPAIEHKTGNFAAPISLHQWFEVFKKEFKENFNTYFKMAKHFEERSKRIVPFSEIESNPKEVKIKAEEALF